MCLTLTNRYTIHNLFSGPITPGVCKTNRQLIETQVTEEQLAALFVSCGQVIFLFQTALQ